MPNDSCGGLFCCGFQRLTEKAALVIPPTVYNIPIVSLIQHAVCGSVFGNANRAFSLIHGRTVNQVRITEGRPAYIPDDI